MAYLRTLECRHWCILANPCFATVQVSTYKIVTVNATRQMAELGRANSQGNSQKQRLTSHPEDSATMEDMDDELHQVDGQGLDEMQTWMLLEVRPCLGLFGTIGACLRHTASTVLMCQHACFILLS